MSEIDVKVARIMKAKVFELDQYEDWTQLHDPSALFIGKNSKVLRFPFDHWQPSENLAHAMEVVDRMRNDWFSFKCWQPCTEPYNAGDGPVKIAVVSFICSAGPCPRHKTTHHNHHGAYDIEGETLPAAICKAALLALRAQ